MYSFCLYILFTLHPFYVSTSEIFLNNNYAKVKIKIFRDDLEDGLRLFFEESISIDSDIKLKNKSHKIDLYIQNKFKLKIDESYVDISMARYNLINDLIEISFSFKYKESPNKISIINNILFDIYKIQKNVVLINYKNKTKSHIFSNQNREKIFNY